MTVYGEPIFYPEGGPTAIRDGAVAALVASGLFKKVFRDKTTPTKDDQLPCAKVRILRDDTEPLGDANVGTPSFTHTLTLAVIAIMQASSDDALTATLDDICLQARTALLCSNDWRQTFEGIEKASIHPSYPHETNNTLVEAPIEIVVTFRSVWPPYLPNELKSVGMTMKVNGAWTCPTCRVANKGANCRACGMPAVPNAISADIDLSEPPCST